MERSEERDDSVEEVSRLPLTRKAWRYRRGGAAGLAVGVGVLVCVPFRDHLVDALVGYVALVFFAAWAARLQRAQRLLLRMELVPRSHADTAIACLERLLHQARGDAKLEACLLASIAALELHRRDERRGLSLFRGLRARGWTPRSLVGPATRNTATVLTSAATMAAVEAASGEIAEAEGLLPSLERGTGPSPATLMLRAILCLRRGDADAAARVPLPARPQRLAGRSGDFDALAMLHAFARAQSGESPYRLSGALERHPWASDPPRWLTANWPSLGAFAESLRA